MAKTTTKKSAKSKATKAKSSKAATNAERAALNSSLREKAVKLRDKGTKIGDIAEALSTTTNKVQMLLLVADMKPKDRIKGHDPELIVAARDEQNQSWAHIAARSGDDSIGKVKRVYSEATGRDANQGYAAVQARAPKSAPVKAAKGKKTAKETAIKATKGKVKSTKATKGSAAKKSARKKSANPSKG